MRNLTVVLFLAVGCHGTVLTQAESGYAIAPAPSGVDHAGTLTLHAGGSRIEGFGYGGTGRVRVFSGGWSIPEVGPHVFLLRDGPSNDSSVGAYVRAVPLIGVGQVDGEFAPLLTAQISPGILLHPADDATALTLSLTAEYSGSPGLGYNRFWAGLQVGYAAAGILDK